MINFSTIIKYIY